MVFVGAIQVQIWFKPIRYLGDFAAVVHVFLRPVLLKSIVHLHITVEFFVKAAGVFAEAFIKVVVVVLIQIIGNKFVIKCVGLVSVRPEFFRETGEFALHHNEPGLRFLSVDEVADKKRLVAAHKTNFITFAGLFQINFETIWAVL